MARRAKFHGREVSLKVSSATQERGWSLSRSIDDVSNEAYWFDIFSAKGWAPNLLGLSFYERTVTVDHHDVIVHHYVLVTDFVEGVKITGFELEHNELPYDFVTTLESLQSLKEFYAFLEENEIYPDNLKMILRKDGSWRLVDLEWYRPISKLSDKDLAEYKKTYQRNKERLLPYFEDHLAP